MYIKRNSYLILVRLIISDSFVETIMQKPISLFDATLIS